MRAKKHIGSLMMGCLVLIMVMVKPAHAYLDPGSGSAILQGVLAAIAAVAIALKLYWHKILVLLGIRKKIHIPEKKSDTAIKSVKDESK